MMSEEEKQLALALANYKILRDVLLQTMNAKSFDAEDIKSWKNLALTSLDFIADGAMPFIAALEIQYLASVKQQKGGAK